MCATFCGEMNGQRVLNDQFFLNKFSFNPAYAYLSSGSLLSFYSKKQWDQVPGSILSREINYTEYAPMLFGGGWGVGYNNEIVGESLFTKNKIHFSFAFRNQNGDKKSGISSAVGGRVNLNTFSIDQNSIFSEQLDPVLGNVLPSSIVYQEMIPSYISFDFGGIVKYFTGNVLHELSLSVNDWVSIDAAGISLSQEDLKEGNRNLYFNGFYSLNYGFGAINGGLKFSTTTFASFDYMSNTNVLRVGTLLNFGQYEDEVNNIKNRNAAFFGAYFQNSYFSYPDSDIQTAQSLHLTFGYRLPTILFSAGHNISVSGITENRTGGSWDVSLILNFDFGDYDNTIPSHKCRTKDLGTFAYLGYKATGKGKLSPNGCDMETNQISYPKSNEKYLPSVSFY